MLCLCVCVLTSWRRRMTPLLQQPLKKLPATTSLVKIEERRKGAQKIQEVYYVTEKASSTEEVWEHEEVAEEHAKVSYEDEASLRLGQTKVSLSEVDILSTTDKARDKKSELRGEISVTDSSKRKETRLTKETVVQESESDRDRDVTTMQRKPTREKIEEGVLIQTIESPTEITDERKDSVSVRQPSDKRDVSKQETSVKKGKEMSIKTESKERHVRQQEDRKAEETTMVKEIRLVKERIPSGSEADQTKAVVFSTEARKQTQTLEIKGKVLTDSVDRDVEIISDIPEEKYRRIEEITEMTMQQREVTVKDKPAKVGSTQGRMIEEETSRKEETHIKPAVISESQKHETSAPKKKPELAEKKLKSDEKIDRKKEKVSEKPKPKEVTPTVKPQESVTDIELKKPKVVEQETEFEVIAEQKKKKEESQDVRPQRVETEKTKEETSLLIEDTVPTKPSKPGERRIPPSQTASRGTERKSNIIIHFHR